MLGNRFYYLHPLLAGPIDAWTRQLDRIAGMRFDTVVVAPVFAAGQTGDLFLTADFDRLDARLGAGAAATALARLAAKCRSRQLCLMLDVVIDRVATEKAVNGLAAWYRIDDSDELPDPRRPPRDPGTAEMAADADVSGLTGWWAARLSEWADAGVTGFRCIRPDGVPVQLWRDLIGTVRESHSETSFMASALGPDAGKADALAECGFDLVACCSADWDYRAESFADSADNLTHIAPLVAMPEAPFTRRLGWMFTDAGRARRAAHRAVDFTTAYGAGWMMPMGFEFGAARTWIQPATGPRISSGSSPKRHSTLLRKSPRPTCGVPPTATSLRRYAASSPRVRQCRLCC